MSQETEAKVASSSVSNAVLVDGCLHCEVGGDGWVFGYDHAGWDAWIWVRDILLAQ